jgi:hypothetical protein
MDPADGADPLATSWQPWPARSRAKVVFLPGEGGAAERIARRLFQHPLERWEYAGLAGAPDDARVEVGASRGGLYLEIGDPAGAAYRGYFYVRRAAGHLVVINDGFHIPLRHLQRRGLGLHVVQRQVAVAAALGVARIELLAGRRREENGYYTWPRFGFEGVLPALLRRMLPVDLRGARTVLDLMECEKGRAWWRENGVTIGARFELAAGSRSRAALDRYVRTRMNSPSGPKTNLENRPAIAYGDVR